MLSRLSSAPARSIDGPVRSVAPSVRCLHDSGAQAKPLPLNAKAAAVGVARATALPRLWVSYGPVEISASRLVR
jgi:hypothetical protein